MARPQNSPRGLFAKDRIDVGAQQITANSTALLLSGGVQIAGAGGLLSANSTGITLPGTLTLGGAIVGSDSTTLGVVVGATAALPGNASLEGFAFLSNSTGNAILVNTTDTTWKYLNVTTAQPT